MKYLIIILLLISCGTEVGNPWDDSDDGGEGGFNDVPVDDETSLFVEKLVSTTCSKLASCFPDTVTISVCHASIEAIDGFDERLGLGSSYSDLSDIEEAEEAETIISDSDYSKSCLDEIDSLACGDPEVVLSFDETSPSDYSNTFEIISSSSTNCVNVFQ